MNNKFWNHVAIAGPNECWPWLGAKDHYGYGKYYSSNIRRVAGSHRIAYELVNGEIPPGLFVLHSCDNPICCNPAHLHVGTNRDNAIESLIRRRANNGNLKVLKLEDVGIIRKMALYKFIPVKIIASKYGYAVQTIRDITNMRTWKDIHPICKSTASHYILSDSKGYFIPLCPAHKDMFPDKEVYPIENLGQRDFPGCSFVL